MPFREERYKLATNIMMRGPKAKSITPEERELFLSKHREIVQWAVETYPRCRPVVMGAVAKCAVIYGTARLTTFLVSLKESLFQGENDPVYHLWFWLIKNKGSKYTEETYFRTITAVRAYAEGRTIRYMRKAKVDIFDWTPTYEIKSVRKKKTKNKFNP